MPTSQEFDTQPIIDLICKANRHCYLPVINDEKSIHFVRYQQDAELEANEFSILEPVDRYEVIAPSQLDVVLMPLVAFDNYGHRLGMGGGYYDRTFNFLQNQLKRKVKMIGVAFAQQQAETIESDPWDIKLDGVLTEKGFIKFG